MISCPWRIGASYSSIVKCLQIKTFQDEHHCSVSFKNKMAIVAMIAQHFEATIKNHPNTKLRKIQRRCASEMHIVKCTTEKVWDDLYSTLEKKYTYS
ncbi:hypothetical protein Gotur_020466 [Gossypium turneri]